MSAPWHSMSIQLKLNWIASDDHTGQPLET